MACRLPVIAERNMLTQQYVADGITGLSCSAGRSVGHGIGSGRVHRRPRAMRGDGETRDARLQREFSERDDRLDSTAR
jgi:hypothetical protein